MVNTNWAQFRYSVKHKGANPVENVLSASNVAGIDEDWSFTTGSTVTSSPAVANGVAYVGSGDNNVYALNGSTGVKLWSIATGSLINASPAVANEAVYVASGDRNLYAFDVAPARAACTPNYRLRPQHGQHT
jgi:outer membrane protein assembly factor BamB